MTEETVSIFYDHAVLICAAAFVILMTAYGRSRGFMAKLLSFGSVMVTLAAELQIYPAVLEFISSSEEISGFLTEVCRDFIEGAAVTAAQSAAGMSAADASAFADSPLYSLLGLDVLADNAAALTADIAGRILCFVILFVILRLIVRLLFLVAAGLRMIRLIDWLDSLLGAVFGFAESIVYIWLAMFVISGFPGYAFASFVLGQISESAVLSWLYSQNLVISFFLGMLV